MSKQEAFALWLLAAGIFLWSAVGPYDRLTWLLEVVPVIIGVALIVLTHRTHRLSTLLYRLLLLHAVILMVGGHYTYALVPVGFWVQDAFDLARNHYDRLGHFVQGFIPAILAREMLLQYSPLPRGGWLGFLGVSICLAFSASYEILEWWTALAWGADAESFLATQGDVWDTQWDMFLALVGAITATLVLATVHDRSLQTLPARDNSSE